MMNNDEELRIQEDRERRSNYREETESFKKPSISYPNDDVDEMLDEIRELQKRYLRTLKRNGFYEIFNEEKGC